MKTELTIPEKKRRLAQVERELTEQMEGFVKTGILLTEIRDDRLYEAAGHNNFKAYLSARSSRFGMSTSHAYRLISSSSLRTSAAGPPAGDSEPVWTEKAMRPLAELAQEKPKEGGGTRGCPPVNRQPGPRRRCGPLTGINLFVY